MLPNTKHWIFEAWFTCNTLQWLVKVPRYASHPPPVTVPARCFHIGASFRFHDLPISRSGLNIAICALKRQAIFPSPTFSQASSAVWGWFPLLSSQRRRSKVVVIYPKLSLFMVDHISDISQVVLSPLLRCSTVLLYHVISCCIPMYHQVIVRQSSKYPFSSGQAPHSCLEFLHRHAQSGLSSRLGPERG